MYAMSCTLDCGYHVLFACKNPSSFAQFVIYADKPTARDRISANIVPWRYQERWITSKAREISIENSSILSSFRGNLESLYGEEWAYTPTSDNNWFLTRSITAQSHIYFIPQWCQWQPQSIRHKGILQTKAQLEKRTGLDRTDSKIPANAFICLLPNYQTCLISLLITPSIILLQIVPAIDKKWCSNETQLILRKSTMAKK